MGVVSRHRGETQTFKGQQRKLQLQAVHDTSDVYFLFTYHSLSFVLIVTISMVMHLFLLCKRRHPLYPSSRLSVEQKSKWKFILIEFPRRKLGSHVVRLEKHETMPRRPTLFCCCLFQS